MLQANDVIQVGKLTYSTDAHGRIKKVEGVLEHVNPLPRDEIKSKPWRRAVSDGSGDAGHLIGERFGGESFPINMVAMDGNLNQAGAKWYKLEDVWEEAIRARNKVNVEIEVIYAPGGSKNRRPTKFRVRYEITDKKGNTIKKVGWQFYDN